MPYLNEFSEPTNAQYQAIGRVVAKWSVVEIELETILARLAHSPDYFGHALTNDLSINNRITALRNLCAIHRLQLGSHVIPESTLIALAQAATEISTYKDARNQIAHYIWLRQTDDKLFGFKARSKPAPKEGGPWAIMTLEDIDALADHIGALSDRLCALCELLPKLDWPSPHKRT